MISKRDLAQRLDITLEMITRHGLDDGMSEAAFAALEQDPPPWLIQSRANRKKGARPIWSTLTCNVCGYSESARPKKWWPEFTYLTCRTHAPQDLPAPESDQHRTEIEGVGSRFIGIVDVTV
ncbi:hypothetical protein DC31_04280 [Microbacterium sp. CH12i]|uniref:hypothetical protein n=1 Tax=Microbacterium sp. CH12i TaxID=1479651 RepID=UPI0004611B9C|nr:hypothetical protein [Microbacterium sp. CH12i]KDA05198.1 hypothetical protein DC31_04280 [Microbacterium sp. CH12i]